MAAEKKPRAAKAETKTTTATTKPKTVRARKPKVAAVTGEQIAERAYYLWVEGSDGDAFAHWVRAERELTAA
jgi:hypothetical protein